MRLKIEEIHFIVMLGMQAECVFYDEDNIRFCFDGQEGKPETAKAIAKMNGIDWETLNKYMKKGLLSFFEDDMTLHVKIPYDIAQKVWTKEFIYESDFGDNFGNHNFTGSGFSSLYKIFRDENRQIYANKRYERSN